MLVSIVLILLGGFFAGQIARRLGAPPLIGMILAGVVIGPQFGDWISTSVLDSAGIVRTVAVMIILMKAGLGLDREKLKQQGTVALRLGFLPAIVEALVIAFAAMWIFQFDFLTGLLLGFMLGAESPAVIVPGMLRLKTLGLGVKKGITDAILSGSALSDVIMLLGFNLLIGMLVLGQIDSLELFGLTLPPAVWIPLQLALQIAAGLVIGYLIARFVYLLLTRQQWSTTSIHDGAVAGGLAILLVLLAESYPFFPVIWPSWHWASS
jgi:solute carrier family 9B (sodium/hydrogen exchanger), member 1/2